MTTNDLTPVPKRLSKRDLILGLVPETARLLFEDELGVLIHETYEDGWADGYGHCAQTVKNALADG